MYWDLWKGMLNCAIIWFSAGLRRGKVMSIFRPAPRKDSNDPSLVNVAVTIKPNMPGVPGNPHSKREIGHSPDIGIKNLWAGTDSARLKQLDPQTLEPITTTSQKALNPLLIGPLSGAHSQTDPLTEDVFNYNLELGLHATYRIFKTHAATGETEILATFPSEAAYIHSFFLSEDYVILAVWSSRYEKNGIKIPIEQNILDVISPFSPSNLTHWYIVDRRQGRGLVAEFESPAAFSFHSINAWQEMNNEGDVDILCELIEFENLDVLHKFYYENLTSEGKNTVSFNAKFGDTSMPRLARYRLDNIQRKSLERSSRSSSQGLQQAKLELMVDKLKAGELPTINPKFAMRKHRYVYGVVNRGHSSFVDGICKTDTTTGEVLFWDDRGCTPGEAIFVANPAGDSEDDGILMSVVLDGRKVGKESSFLLVLDAMTMKEMARAGVNGVVGLGFHGIHVQQRSL
jgi:torulene dioxygenase